MEITKFCPPNEVPLAIQKKMQASKKWYSWQKNYVIEKDKTFAVASFNLFERIVNFLSRDLYIKKRIEKLSAGRVSLNVFSASQLKKATEVAEKFFGNNVDKSKNSQDIQQQMTEETFSPQKPQSPKMDPVDLDLDTLPPLVDAAEQNSPDEVQKGSNLETLPPLVDAAEQNSPDKVQKDPVLETLPPPVSTTPQTNTVNQAAVTTDPVENTLLKLFNSAAPTAASALRPIDSLIGLLGKELELKSVPDFLKLYQDFSDKPDELENKFKDFAEKQKVRYISEVVSEKLNTQFANYIANRLKPESALPETVSQLTEFFINRRDDSKKEEITQLVMKKISEENNEEWLQFTRKHPDLFTKPENSLKIQEAILKFVEKSENLNEVTIGKWIEAKHLIPYFNFMLEFKKLDTLLNDLNCSNSDINSLLAQCEPFSRTLSADSYKELLFRPQFLRLQSVALKLKTRLEAKDGYLPELTKSRKLVLTIFKQLKWDIEIEIQNATEHDEETAQDIQRQLNEGN